MSGTTGSGSTRSGGTKRGTTRHGAIGRWIIITAVAVVAVTAAIFYFLGREKIEGPTVEGPLRPVEEARLMAVRLYFGDAGGYALRPEQRVIVAGETLTDRLRDCIRELAQGSLTGLAPTLPPETALTGVFVDPWGLAYLDFTRSLLGTRTRGDGEEWLAVGSIVRTVCDNFPEIREVRLLIGGQVVTSLWGYIDLEEPLSSRDFPDEQEPAPDAERGDAANGVDGASRMVQGRGGS